MRAFSDLEKQLVRRMIELDDKVGSLNVLDNLLDSFYGKTHLPDQCYIELKSERDVSIRIREEALNQNGLDWIREIDKDISKKLLSVVALFEYLEAERLAHFVGDINLNSLGEVWADTKYIRFEFLDDSLKPLIYKYSRKKIFVSETLRMLEKNKFKTDEEIRHEKEVYSMKDQLNITRLALCVTFIGLFVSVLVPVFVTSTVEVKSGKFSEVLFDIENQMERMSGIAETSNERIKGIESAILHIRKSTSEVSKSHSQEIQMPADGGG